MTLYKKVLLFVLLLILPLNLVALSVTREAMNATTQQMEVTDYEFAQSCMTSLEAKMDSAFSLLYFFTTSDADCIRMMRQQSGPSYSAAKYSFFVSLKNLAYMTNGADGYFFYLQKTQDCLFYSGNSISEQFKTAALPNALADLPQQQWSICTIENTTYLVLVQAHSSTLYGVWINLDRVRDELVLGLSSVPTQAVFSQQGVPKIDKQHVGAAVTKRGITLTVLQSRADVLRNISPKVRFFYVVAIAYLAATPLLCAFINLYLLQPLKVVVRANRQIQKGNLDYRITAKGKSPEFDEAFHSFNAMAQDLKTTKIECYEKEIETQKMALRNLQLQIRPHFLLNHFNLIYTLAQRNQRAQIEDIILQLADYFRFLFRSDRETEPFGQELPIIRGYLKVANIRYFNLIDAVIDVTPEVETVCVPPLLIHNFVENAIKHGIQQGRILHVVLTGRWEHGVVTFCIHDNGNGMDRETLARTRKIFSGEIDLEHQNAHIGLYNSYKRLKAFLGEEASITVESTPGTGTCFSIRFPYDVQSESIPALRTE